MEADLQVEKSDEVFAKLQSQHMEKLLPCLRRACENFLCRTRLRSTIKTDFFEATFGHPKFYVEKHGWPIFKTPASVLIYAKLYLCKQ